jgi:hypothetical protein
MQLSTAILFIFAALQFKHLVCDFLYQPPYMWMNKGNIKHWGGYAHAGLHVIGSLVLFIVVGQFFTLNAVTCAGILIGEFVAHYSIDWAKMNLNAYYGYKCNTHEEFWWFLGADQFLHQLTYVIMIALLITAGL